MTHILKSIFVLLSLPLSVLTAAPETEWMLHKTEDGSHPNDNEQQMVWLMNRARTNPIEEGKWLAGDTLALPANVTGSIQSIPVNTEVLKSEFCTIPPQQPAAFNRFLYEGSKLHSEFLSTSTFQTHEGQIQRIPMEFHRNGGSLSIFWRSQDGLHGHAALNIDWGFGGFGDEFGMQPGRGHRSSIQGLGFGNANVGIAMVPDNDQQTPAGPLVASMAYYNASTSFPDNFNRFVVGTIWTDTNGNQQYDPGEGHGGVTVMPDIGQYFAITGDAGGFAIPASEAGTYTLTISGGAITLPEERTVEISNQSALMIWNTSDKWPDPPEPVAPLMQVAREETITYSFAVEDGLHYQLRSSTDLTNFVNDDRPISGDDNNRSFEITQTDIDSGIFFEILVTLICP